MRTANTINRYRSVKVKTASPGEVLVMLYDGVLRFLAEAQQAMQSGERARCGERLDRSYAIVAELLATLRPEVAPALCERLAGIYNFSLDRIVQANLEQKPDLLGEVVHVLAPLRDGFREAVQQAPDPAANAAAQVTIIAEAR